MRTRPETFGAWVHVDEPPMLVAVDRALAARLGVEGGDVWGPAPPSPRPLEAHVAITSKCGVGCVGCYQDATPDGAAPPLASLETRLTSLAADGVFVVAFGGGEPLTRDDLPELARAARRVGLVPVMTTSGMGLTEERARTLVDFAQINVSYDGERDAYRDVRGVDGAQHAERAMRALSLAGIRFGINVVLTRRTFDRVPAAVARARELGASEVQLLRFKPAGRGTGLVYLESRLTNEQVVGFCDLVDALVSTSGLSVRIDCALVPFLSTRFTEAAALSSVGVLGCEAGRWLASVDTSGARGPCSFYKGEDIQGVAGRWARHSESPPDPCASCGLLSVCRGGCRVVALHAGDDRSPDPECPRVVAWSAHA